MNLKNWFEIQKNMKFLTVFLNYYENNINFIQTIPVLIKNIIDYNWVGGSSKVLNKFPGFSKIYPITARRHGEMAVGEEILSGGHSFRAIKLPGI